MTEKSTEIELKSKLFRLPLSLCASVCCSGSGTVDMDFKLIDFGLIDALGINSPVLMITSDNPPAAFSSIWLPTSVFCSSFPSSCLPSLPEVSILRQQKNNNNRNGLHFDIFQHNQRRCRHFPACFSLNSNNSNNSNNSKRNTKEIVEEEEEEEEEKKQTLTTNQIIS